MKNIFIIFTVLLMFSITSFGQTDTVKSDKVYMLDGSTMDGKVKTVKPDIIVFTEKETTVDYELNKSDIKVIVLASGKPMVFNSPPIEKQVTKSAVVTTTPKTRSNIVENTQVETTPPVETKPDGVQFSMAGLLLGSLQNWNDLKTDESKMGFGFSGDLFAGIIIDDMYVGIGPHLGMSFWTTSASYSGYEVSATTSVTDFGFDVGAAWEGFYITFGAGSGNVSITASAGGDSETYDLPESIGYSRIGFGWFDSFAIGFAIQSYSDKETPNNLDRFEINFGWAF